MTGAKGDIIEMNLIFSLPHLSISGAGLFYSPVQYLKALKKAGITAQLMGRAETSTAQELTDLNISNLISFKATNLINATYRRSRAITNRNDIDIIHSHGLWGDVSLASTITKRLKGYIEVVSPHGMLDSWALGENRKKKELFLKTVELPRLKSSKCIHALCDSERDSIRSIGYNGPIAIIPNVAPIAPSMQNCLRNGSNEIIRKLSGTNFGLYLGRIHKKKGIEELISAIDEIKYKVKSKNYSLLICGWGEDEYVNKIKSEVANRKLTEVINFLNPQKGIDKYLLMYLSKFLLLPSYSEGQPMVVLEAWACGVPTVMTDACNLSIGFEWGAARRTTLDIDHLAETIIQMINRSPEEIILEGKNSLHLATKMFSEDRIGSDLKILYEWLLGNKSVPLFVEE